MVRKEKKPVGRSAFVIDLEKSALRAKDDRSHECQHCSRTYRHYRNLRAHVKESHPNELLQKLREKKEKEKEYPHECLVCHQKFNTMTALRSHRSRKHKKVEVPEEKMDQLSW